MYNTMYKHLEQYEINLKRNLTGIDSSTGELLPDWIKSAAASAKDKIGKYYLSSDWDCYVIGTGMKSFESSYTLYSLNSDSPSK